MAPSTTLLTAPETAGRRLFGTVDLAQNGANDVKVTVTLFNNNKFVTTGSADALDFNINTNPTITESNFSSGFGAGQTTGGLGFSIHADGTGDFEYSEICTSCGTGGSNPNPGPDVFDVTAPGLTPTSFIQNTSGQFFAVDILSGTTGNTGAVDASAFSAAVPAPVIGHGLVVVLAVGGVFFGGRLLERLNKHRLRVT